MVESSAMANKRIFLIDAPGFYYRAFFGIKGNLRSLDGRPTNAVYGFTRMIKKIIDEKPDYLLVALDSKAKTFRHEMYPDYKATRQKMPEDLSIQIPIIEKLIEVFNLPVLKMDGYEADDLIGTASVLSQKEGLDVTIYSGDKDLMQLVNDSVKVFDPLKEKLYGIDEVKEKFGVPPSLVIDMLGLMGDSSDNIPGVPGVGAKTARKLLLEYGSIKNLLLHTDDIKKPKLRESLKTNSDMAILSRELATIKTDIELTSNLESWATKEPDAKKSNELFKELGFKSMTISGKPEPKGEKGKYKAIFSNSDFDELLSKLKKAKMISVDTETTSVEPVKAKLVGISLSIKEGEGFYIPLCHDYEDAPVQLSKSDVLAKLKPILEDEEIDKCGQNLKYDFILFKKEGIELKPIAFDTLIASYLLNAEERRHNLNFLAEKHLNYEMIRYEEVAGKGTKEIPFNKVGIETAVDYASEDADIALRLTNILKTEIDAKYKKLYYDLELPLILVLAKMEMHGIKIDGDKLAIYSKELDEELQNLQAKIYQEAGEEFNIASPKQLAKILFEKLGLKVIKKTKTGASTDAKVLEALSDSHPLPALLLRSRTLAKLKGTYVDPMPQMADPQTGRIHTSFNQAMAATGRLSSSSPNLQNIPVRSEEGRKIRGAFNAEHGSLLISADYSQIELRILAHLSGDKLLTESFNKDEDVHERTAIEIFGAIGGTSPDSRRIAKAVNFSIIYGKTAFGLARDLKIPRAEAVTYIDNYFDRYKGVKTFISDVVAEVKKKGYAETMMGRRRELPDINSSNKNIRDGAERMAVNSVVQGSAADLIKKAMLDIDREIKSAESKMLLQVHDELIFETPEGNANTLSSLIREKMESAWKLKVPLKVSLSSGKSWAELH